MHTLGILRVVPFVAAPLAASVGAQPQRFFELRRMLPADLAATSAVALGDVDGDGDSDVLTGTVQEGIRLYPNDGSGVFTDASGTNLPILFDQTSSVALGDVDGDGDLDALIGNYGQDRLYLNNGAGFFIDATAQLPAILDSTAALALGDVDGDGDLDAVIGNWPSPPQADRLLLNNGAGVFTDATAQLPPILASTRALALGDMEGDGDLDLLIGSNGTPNRLYLNNGTGLFSDASAQVPAFSDFTSAIALGDVDGDGDLDALIGNGGSLGQQDRLFLNGGSGVFLDATAQLPPDFDDTVALALGDVDGDGDLDALLNGYPGLADRLYLNNGSGLFADASPQLPAVVDDCQALALGDVDGDGDLDAFFGDAGWGYMDRLYLNDGGGVFTDVSSPIPARPDDVRDVERGDVDGDGDPDLLVVNFNQRARLYLVDGSGAFTDATSQFPPVVSGGVAAALGDVDGDGDLDALVAYDPDLPRLFLNNGSGAFTYAAAQLPVISFPGRDVALGDVDGDGDLDAVFGNIGPERLYLNNSSGVFTDTTGQLPATFFDTQAVALGDVDGDGDLDAVFGNGGTPGGEQDRLYLNDGSGSFTDATVQLPAIVDLTFDVARGDLDGDGDLDLLIGNGNVLPGEQNRLFLNDGAGTFSDASFQLPAFQDFTLDVALADMDEDGDLDALVGNVGQDRLLLNAGSAFFSDATALLPSADDNTRAVAAGDIDGDGDADVVFGNLGQVKVLSNLDRQLAWRGIPRIGKPLVLDLYGPSSGAWLLGFALGTANVPIPPFGTLRLDPVSLTLLLGGVLDAQGRAAFPIQVPANPALLGVPVYWQAIVAFPARFTNLEITTATDL